MTPSNIFSTNYLGPIEYYFHLLNSKNSLIDIYENFIKQTYRNRCRIIGPNGIQSLIIPLSKTKTGKRTKDMKISYAENWRKIHWKSIEAAYRRSPYFEFYEDDFYPFYHDKKYEYLIDFNWELQQKIIDLLSINVTINNSHKYVENEESVKDYRGLISPKKNNSTLIFTTYTQVFEDRNSFAPNLSILDLLCNEGPNTTTYLSKVQCLN